LVLAGDAAHVVSPIGGQGMNLGWLDAVALADAVGRVRERGPAAYGPELAAYERRRRRSAQVALWRAALNTRLGRPAGPRRAAARDALLRRALRPPWASHLAGVFSMRGLA
jgi:2-polyprenyl-6-methoxyphenol hydroxylase-like FAD-dependent oxidoreductase